MSSRVLLIDDDVRLYELLKSYLEQNGFAVTCAADGPSGLTALGTGSFDAVLLDVMMPGMDGLEVMKRIRARGNRVPVLMLTAKGDETDRVVGLELGADDYVPKPFSPRELLARMRAMLRRSNPGSEQGASEQIKVDGVLIDVAARAATLECRTLDLTGVEFDILVALARRAGRVVPREALLTEAGRGDVSVSDRTVTNLIENANRHGGGASTVRVVSRGDARFVAFEVEDDGAGFAAGEEEKIFEPFYRRAQAAGAPQAAGVGLGLALVKRIAEAHGGRAYAVNRAEGGALVGIELERLAPAQRASGS